MPGELPSVVLYLLSAFYCRQMGNYRRLGPASGQPNTATVAMRGVTTRPIQERRLGLGKQNVPQRHHRFQYVMGSFPGPAVIFTEQVDGLERKECDEALGRMVEDDLPD
jgi:hypothetical protein